MAVSISVAAVIAAAESRLRIPACTTSTAYTAAEMLATVQRAAKALFALARERMGEEFDTLLDAALVTVANTSDVSIAALTNFGELYRLTWLYDSTTLVEMGETSVADFEPPAFNPRAWGSSGPNQPSYRLINAATLRVTPCPNAVYNLRVWYTAHTPVATASDTFNGRLDWDEWLIAYVCREVAIAKKRDFAPFELALRTLEGAIFSPDRKRAPESVRVIRDVESAAARYLDRKTGDWWIG